MEPGDRRHGSGLDREYSPTRTVPAAAGYLRDYRRRTLELRGRRSGREVVAYGPTAAERIEIFRAGAGPRPAVVFVHGGGWDSLSLDDSAFLAPELLSRGVSTVVVDYGHAPANTLDAIAAMVGRALAHVVGSAAALGIDRTRIVVVGTSAGAHLVALALMSGSHGAYRSYPSYGSYGRGELAGALLLSGIYDLEPLRRTYYAGLLALDEARVARCSPARLSEAISIDVVLAVGSDESEEFRRQTTLMGEHLRALGCRVTTHEVTGRNHFDLPYDVTDPGTIVGGNVMRMIKGISAAGHINQREDS